MRKARFTRGDTLLGRSSERRATRRADFVFFFSFPTFERENKNLRHGGDSSIVLFPLFRAKKNRSDVSRHAPLGLYTLLIMTGTRPECQSLATKHTSSP
jgi:hypothetical protein